MPIAAWRIEIMQIRQDRHRQGSCLLRRHPLKPMRIIVKFAGSGFVAALYTMAHGLLRCPEKSMARGRGGNGERKGSIQGDGCRGARPDRARLVDHGAAHHRHAARFPGAGRLRRNARQRRLAARHRGEADRRRAQGRARHRHAGDPHPRGPSAGSFRRAAGQGRARRAEPAHRRSRADGPDPDSRRSRPRHHSGALSDRRRNRHRQARQGRVLRHLARRRRCAWHQNLARLRRHHRGLRQHHGARGQRPRLSLHRARPTAAPRTFPNSTRWA